MNNSNSVKVKKIAVIDITAATYFVLTIINPFSSGEIQCRLSEIMNLLVFFNPIFAPGVVLGCLISNLYTPLNLLLDMTLGTLSTVLAVVCISKSKNLLVASLFPTIFSGITVGYILFVSFGSIGDFSPIVSYAIYTGQVMLGQFIAVTVIGYPLFKILIKTNQRFIKFITNI